MWWLWYIRCARSLCTLRRVHMDYISVVWDVCLLRTLHTTRRIHFMLYMICTFTLCTFDFWQYYQILVIRVGYIQVFYEVYVYCVLFIHHNEYILHCIWSARLLCTIHSDYRWVIWVHCSVCVYHTIHKEAYISGMWAICVSVTGLLDSQVPVVERFFTKTSGVM